MVLVEGGPCIAQKKGPNNATQPCGAEQSHCWYAGPIWKNCYQRRRTAEQSSGRGTKRSASDEPVDDVSGGDILMEVLRVNGSRCRAPPLSAGFRTAQTRRRPR